MKIKISKCICDLCGKEIEKRCGYGWFGGNAYILDGLVDRRRIDLCDDCCNLIKEKGYKTERITK